MAFRAQGATEYLVLLAVVLVIALVGIALLGFFPGTASDAQLTESQIYWQSATPIAIIETAARYWSNYPNSTVPYFRIRNIGNYPIRITKMLGPGGHYASKIYNDVTYPNLRDSYYMAPGEEAYFSKSFMYGTAATRQINFQMGSDWLCADHDNNMCVIGLASNCQNSVAAPGVLAMPSFGFEYIQYVEGQEIVKRQIGAKPLMIKCREPY